MLEQQQKQVNRIIQGLVVPVLLFVAALLPRLLTLDKFLTPDEYRWLGRSRDFLIGVLSGDWAATLRTGHPGVTTMWTGSLGILYRYWTRSSSAPDDLLTFVRQVPNEPLDATYIAPARFPTVVVMSLFVVAFYMLLSRLFENRWVGVIGALLLALDPFHIALSRILHHDALATAFMTLSLLALLGYWLKSWSRRWLLVSAVVAGLSFLSKSPAMFLMPFCALLGLTWAVRRWRKGEWRGWSDAGRLLVDGLLWAVVAWLTLILLWPAMWVIPFKVLGVVFGTSSQYATEGHGKGNFFLGQITRDPGPFFYPLSWLLRTTPLILLGLLALGVIYLRDALGRRPQRVLPDRAISGTLFLFAVLFVAFMTLGEKKQDRYILPIYPVLGALAALGWVYIISYVKFRKPKDKSRVYDTRMLIIFLVLLVHGILVVTNYPYYFAYYNPLLGGARTAARVMTVGWGEGLDQAATFLNELPVADQSRVTSWYHNSFAPFFQGEATYYANEAGQTLSSDYAVVYRNQIQRELPTAELLNYLLRHHTPVFTATLQGVDYVYVYALPMNRRSNWEVSRLPGRVIFFGVGGAELSGEAEIDADGSPDLLRLYWQNEGFDLSEQWWIALEPVTGPMQPWQACSLRSDFADERLEVGALLESECQLGEEVSPGVYHLRVGVGPDADQVTTIPFPEGELAVATPEDDALRLVSRMTALDVLARHLLPQEAYPADLVYQGAVRLIGYATKVVSTDEGLQLQVYLYWQALEPLPLRELGQALGGEIALLSPQETVLATAEGPFSGLETWPDVWSPGEVLTDFLVLPVPDSFPPQSQLKLDVWLNDQWLILSDSKGTTVEPILPVFVTQ